MKLLTVAAGGAIGASLRFLVAAATHGLLGKGFPFGTLLVNVLGSLLVGYLLVWLPEHDETVSLLRLLLVTGILGGFTTYSAFSVETLQLLQDGQLARASLNVALTVVLCLAAAWAGFAIGRGVHP
ncbi:MAG: fluoride efflux transporter CrcB [Xanthomonadales bacterium]|nr:fluoride efflux transporter CrcB [Xanthomonadales bacterium]